jgi:hypothetical protein
MCHKCTNPLLFPPLKRAYFWPGSSRTLNVHMVANNRLSRFSRTIHVDHAR